MGRNSRRSSAFCLVVLATLHGELGISTKRRRRDASPRPKELRVNLSDSIGCRRTDSHPHNFLLAACNEPHPSP